MSDKMLLNTGEKNEDCLVDVKSFKFEQERSRMDLARMIILHEYPFSIVDHFGIEDTVEIFSYFLRWSLTTQL